MQVPLSLIFILGGFLIFSLGLNWIFAVLLSNKKEKISFEESFSILNSAIDIQKKKFLFGMAALSKKYAVLSSNGTVVPPNDNVEKYANDKKKLKTAAVKKIVRTISKKNRERLLMYYSEHGLIDYIIYELDKFDDESSLIGGGKD